MSKARPTLEERLQNLQQGFFGRNRELKETDPGLLFLSSWQEAMPALVHLDPVLDPVDSRVFAVLWLWAKQEG